MKNLQPKVIVFVSNKFKIKCLHVVNVVAKQLLVQTREMLRHNERVVAPQERPRSPGEVLMFPR